MVLIMKSYYSFMLIKVLHYYKQFDAVSKLIYQFKPAIS